MEYYLSVFILSLITEDFGNHSYGRISISSSMKQRGVHDVFHGSLLRIHVPNDDRLFPGRLETQLMDRENNERDWAADKFISHSGSANNAIFEVFWKAGD